METAIAKAVALFRNSPELDDEQAYRALVDAGIDRKLAARLVELVPMAYCRVLLEHTGARFPETFQRHRNDGTISPALPLKCEPVWDVCRSRTPVKTGEDRFVDLESIHQMDDVKGNHGLLPVPERFTGKKSGRAVAAQIRHDDTVALASQQGHDIHETVNVVRPSVKKDHRIAVRRASFRVANVQKAGLYLLQRPKCCAGRCVRRLCGCRADANELGRGEGHCGVAHERAPILFELL
jgi:hypothetical protein